MNRMETNFDDLFMRRSSSNVAAAVNAIAAASAGGHGGGSGNSDYRSDVTNTNRHSANQPSTPNLSSCVIKAKENCLLLLLL